MICEMCFKKPPTQWVCVDDNYEVELCDDCVDALKAEPTIKVERIDA